MNTATAEKEIPRGLRRIIKLLESEGFDTVHADDGEGHDPGCSHAQSTVLVLFADGHRLAHEAMRALIVLRRHGIEVPEVRTDGQPWIEGRYVPSDDWGEIAIHDVHDRMLPPEPN